MYRGYVDLSVDEGLSWSLENGICDAAIARFAARLAADAPGGSPETRDLSAMSQYLSHRSLDYRLLFDSSSGFFRGRDNAGRFSAADFDPRDWGGDYTETNAWGMAFSAPHDPIGLRALHGGPAGLEAKLDCFFSLPETASSDHVGAYGRVIHEMPCRRPRETAQ